MKLFNDLLLAVMKWRSGNETLHNDLFLAIIKMEVKE